MRQSYGQGVSRTEIGFDQQAKQFPQVKQEPIIRSPPPSMNIASQSAGWVKDTKNEHSKSVVVLAPAQRTIEKDIALNSKKPDSIQLPTRTLGGGSNQGNNTQYNFRPN